MSKLDGFNAIAPFYDFLKRIVFGNELSNSEQAFFHMLPLSGNVLVLGGGSGDLLIPLLAERPALTVRYVEASSAMVERARAKLPEGHLTNVTFIHGDEDSIPNDIQFDCVILPFILDVFGEVELGGVCRRIWLALMPGGLCLVTDFVNSGKRWQSLLLWIMYKFFSWVAGIKARSLPDWKKALITSGLTPVKHKPFFHNFIESWVFTRPS
jgi:tRNA (cmo5U34)-methyltransferase